MCLLIGERLESLELALSLPNPTSVCGGYVFYLGKVQQPQEQRYPVLPVYVVVMCFTWVRYSNHKSSATQSYQCMWWLCGLPGYGSLPSPTSVCGGYVIYLGTARYPVLPVYVVVMWCTWVWLHTAAARAGLVLPAYVMLSVSMSVLSGCVMLSVFTYRDMTEGRVGGGYRQMLPSWPGNLTHLFSFQLP